MSAIPGLYRDVLRAHARAPAGRGLPPGAELARGERPSCGDSLTLGASIDGERFVALGFEGHGCLLTLASASILHAVLLGQPVGRLPEARATLERVLAGGSDPGVLGAFAGAARFPVRHGCVRLAWEALGEIVGRGDQCCD